jgi:LAS superfamily LD-carboxypeptidase LdcB
LIKALCITSRRVRLAIVGLMTAALFLGYSEGGQRWLVRLLTGEQSTKSLRYLCPVLDKTAPRETADCRDCTFYPVDKSHRLATVYEPETVPTELPGGGTVLPIVKDALLELFAEAHRHGLLPIVTSAYRSYEVQAQTFRYWLVEEWRHTGDLWQAGANASRYSARAGHSEHQLGTTVDLNCKGCTPFDGQDWRNLALWQFLEANAHRFGFVISYPRNMEDRTGYQYEPWHIRYIGAEYATELFDEGYVGGNGVCLLTFLREKHIPGPNRASIQRLWSHSLPWR